MNSDTFKPYYAVIFTSLRNANDPDGYEKMADRMVTLAKQQRGYLGMESVRGLDGSGITISYWESTDAIKREYNETAAARAALKKRLGKK